MNGPSILDLIVVGAGPAGLACAIAARREGLDALVLEKGTLVDSIRRFPIGMVFFTTRERLEIGGHAFTVPRARPTREEAMAYYRLVVEREGLAVRCDRRVTGIRRGHEGFSVRCEDPFGRTETLRSRAVVLAIGAFDRPRLLGVPGEDLPHVTHRFVEAHEGAGRDVVVVGGGNSAVEAALDLYRHGARVRLVVRDATLDEGVKYWLRPDLENRIAEGAIAAHFETRLVRIGPERVEIESRGGSRSEVPAERVYLLTGHEPDHDFLVRAGVELDPQTRKPLLDPETYESGVEGLFVIGTATAGRDTSGIFIENGRLHGIAVARTLAARLGANRRDA